MTTAVRAFALGAGVLPTLFNEAGLPWDDALAEQMVGVAARQIAASVGARGEMRYSLERSADGQGDERRAGAVRRYLAKLVAARANRATQ